MVCIPLPTLAGIMVVGMELAACIALTNVTDRLTMM
jgi:hypothetical protein